MIDFSFAQENIHKYKFDYSGYLVIVDQIRTAEVLNSYDHLAMKRHLDELKGKYKKELSMIAKIDKQKEKPLNNSKNKVVNELKYILKYLPVIGFIVLGKGKDVGIYENTISYKV